MNNTSQTISHIYDKLFYEYQREGSQRSALNLLPALINALNINSVLDVGCGAGAWLSAYKVLGVSDCIGVDGEYVDRSMLMIDQNIFHPEDITKPFNLNRQFDIVQCLEVAEHVPTECSSTLIQNIIKHGKLVLFSAAVPGQGGEEHINEQPYEFWRDTFSNYGYRLFDYIRPAVIEIKSIEPWYRYNILLFAHDSIIPELPLEVTSTRINDKSSITDYSPITYRIRKKILRTLPTRIISKLAVIKHKLLARSQRQ